MNWKKLTVAHYQALYPVMQNKELTDIDREVQIVCILNNLTETSVDHLPLEKFKQLKKESLFLYTPIPGKPRKHIRGKKRKYIINYNVQKIAFGRYAEVKQFKGENEKQYIDSMHRVMASVVTPMRRLLWFWVPEKYDASKHAEYAEDLQEASFAGVFHSLVFFYHLYTALTKNIRGYMIQGFQSKGMTEMEAYKCHTDLCTALDGFITANKLPTLSASQLKRLGRLQQQKL